MPALAPVPQVVVAAAQVDGAASTLYIRRSHLQLRLQHELSWMQISDDRLHGWRAHAEGCRRRLEDCLAEEEATKFVKLVVDRWLASQVGRWWRRVEMPAVWDQRLQQTDHSQRFHQAVRH